MAKNKLCYPRKNKNGEIISYRFFYSGKDATGKPKQYTKTWKVPKGLSNPRHLRAQWRCDPRAGGAGTG